MGRTTEVTRRIHVDGGYLITVEPMTEDRCMVRVWLHDEQGNEEDHLSNSVLTLASDVEQFIRDFVGERRWTEVTGATFGEYQ